MFMTHGTSIRIATTALFAAAILGLDARAEDRVRLRLGTATAKEAQPKPPRSPRSPELRGTIVQLTADRLTIETPANAIKKEWDVPTEDVVEVFLDGEPEELRSARGMVAVGDGAAALQQLSPAEADDRAAAWDQASDAVKAERMFVKAAANAQVALGTGAALDAAFAGVRDFVRSHPRSHHAAFMQELMGDVLARMGRPDEAIAAYAALATQSPARRIRAGTLAGRLYLDRKRLEDARNAFEKAAAIESPAGDLAALLEKRDARLGLTRCLAREGRAADAIALARQVLSEADPNDSRGLAMIFVALGEAQRAAGDKDRDALISYLTVDAVHNGVPEAHAEALARLAELWEKENHPERARDARQSLEQNYPSSHWAKLVREAADS